MGNNAVISAMLTRLLIALALLLFAALALLAGDVAYPQPPAALDSLPGVYAAMHGATALTDTDMARLRAVPAVRNGWVGYDNGGFDFPAKRYDAGSLFVQTIEGDWLSGLVEVFGAVGKSELLVLVYPTPEHMEWKGNPPGTHPAAAVIVDAGTWARAVGE